jgi:hypothetical protein
MATYAKDIDKTEGPTANGNVVSATCGGTVTAGAAVMLSSGNVVVTAANNSVFYGVALEAGSTGTVIKVARSGCKVKVPYTIAADGYVGCAASGALTTYSANTICGICEVSATLASVIRVI